MKNTNLPQIIFDFDGTIADTLPALVDTIKKIAYNYGYSNVNITQEDIRTSSIKSILKKNEFSLLKLPLLIRQVLKELFNNIDNIQPINGIIELINNLNNIGFKLSIISSNNSSNIKKFLINYNLEYRFDHIYSYSGIFSKHKSINKFLNKHKLEKENIIYIGDEVRDIEAAKVSGIKIIAVTWGFNEHIMLKNHNPDFIAAKPNDILKFLEVYLEKIF